MLYFFFTFFYNQIIDSEFIQGASFRSKSIFSKLYFSIPLCLLNNNLSWNYVILILLPA